MTTIVSAAPTRHNPQSDAGSQLGCTIIAIGLILFGTWFGVTKTVEFAYGWSYDPVPAIEAETEYLHEQMNCEPGETLQITPLDEYGTKSVKCVPGDNVPRRREGESRG